MGKFIGSVSFAQMFRFLLAVAFVLCVADGSDSLDPPGFKDLNVEPSMSAKSQLGSVVFAKPNKYISRQKGFIELSLRTVF